MNPPRVYTCSPSWTPLPPPSPYHPSGSSQCTSSKHPVSCIEPGLEIHFLYDIIHVSTLKKFYLFNWRIITLQYCDGFCHTSTWISHRCPPILNPPPTSLLTLPLWVAYQPGVILPPGHMWQHLEMLGIIMTGWRMLLVKDAICYWQNESTLGMLLNILLCTG